MNKKYSAFSFTVDLTTVYLDGDPVYFNERHRNENKM